jgi:hypothetical protein
MRRQRPTISNVVECERALIMAFSFLLRISTTILRSVCFSEGGDEFYFFSFYIWLKLEKWGAVGPE